MRRLYIFGLLALTAVVVGEVWAEEFTMSTYYPAPYGVYREMRAKRMAIGNTYYDGGTYSWDGGTIDANADLIVEGNVAIGTASLGTNRLEVVGGPTKTSGGLIIETRDATDGDPSSPEDGRMWLRTDL